MKKERRPKLPNILALTALACAMSVSACNYTGTGTNTNLMNVPPYAGYGYHNRDYGY